MIKRPKHLFKIHKLKKLDNSMNDLTIGSQLRMDSKGNLHIDLNFYSIVNLPKRKPRLSKKEKNLLKELDRVYLT